MDVEESVHELLLKIFQYSLACTKDRLCGLVVRVSGYRFRGPGSIPGATRFLLRSSGSGMGFTQPRDDN
jgi:hypothetical protein